MFVFRVSRLRQLSWVLLLPILMANDPAQSQERCSETLTVALPNIPPYSIHVNDTGFNGQDVQLLKKVSEVSGCKLIFKPIPWKRGLKLLQRDKIDVIIMASWRKKRTEFGQYTRPYRWETQLISARKSFPAIDSLTSMTSLVDESFLIGSVRGTYHGEEFKEIFEHGPGQKFVREITDYNQAVTLIRRHRIDGIVSDSGVLRYFSETADFDDYVFLKFPVFRNKVHFLLSKSVKKSTLAALNKAIEQIMTTEAYSNIYGPENLIDLTDETVIN
ncbi:MAG: transporter substrate-binding domain-containing protein [Halopseudomonas aestusnigri]